MAAGGSVGAENVDDDDIHHDVTKDTKYFDRNTRFVLFVSSW